MLLATRPPPRRGSWQPIVATRIRAPAVRSVRKGTSPRLTVQRDTARLSSPFSSATIATDKVWGKALNDPNWQNDTCTTSADCNGQACNAGLCSHSNDWRKNRSGVAEEAGAVLFGRVSTGPGEREKSFEAAFAKAVELGVDITNSSWSLGSQCDITTSTALEDQVEVAFDDGILPVFSAGNFDGDDSDDCNVGGAGDTPKALTVNAYDASTANCSNFPNTRCLLDSDLCDDGEGNPVGCCARGGVDAQVRNNGTISRAVTAIDLVAPHAITTVTGPGNGTLGQPTYFMTGTSFAAPHVAGLSALVKDKFLAGNKSWINSPGRLQTVMLHMGDRHYSDDPSDETLWTSQKVIGGDEHYGFGRVRMRLHASGGGLEPSSPWRNCRTRITPPSTTMAALLVSYLRPVNALLAPCHGRR